MKKFCLGILLILSSAFAIASTPDTKVAYLDLYQRGGARHLRTTLMFKSEKIYLGKMTTGQALDMLAPLGWTIDNTYTVQRFNTNGVLGICFPATRHKVHFIMKKDYPSGENPFEFLSNLNKPDESSAETKLPSISKKDKKTIEKLDQIENRINIATTVEELKNTISSLQMIQYLITDDNLKNRFNNLEQAIKDKLQKLQN